MQFPLNLLGGDLAKNQLLGKVLRSDDDRVCARTRAQAGQQNDYKEDVLHAWLILRSNNPIPASASNARAAAGTAPARICRVSTEATPRKMRTPKPPPPITAAITAVPIFVTTATRIPAMMVGAANGSSIRRSSCMSVIPIAIAASRTGKSTLEMPTMVLRRIGSNEYSTRQRMAVCFPIPPMKGTG